MFLVSYNTRCRTLMGTPGSTMWRGCLSLGQPVSDLVFLPYVVSLTTTSAFLRVLDPLSRSFGIPSKVCPVKVLLSRFVVPSVASFGMPSPPRAAVESGSSFIYFYACSITSPLGFIKWARAMGSTYRGVSAAFGDSMCVFTLPRRKLAVDGDFLFSVVSPMVC